VRNWNRNGRYAGAWRALVTLRSIMDSRFGKTVPELCEDAECGRRTVYRILNVIGEAGFRVRRIGERSGSRVRYSIGRKEESWT